MKDLDQSDVEADARRLQGDYDPAEDGGEYISLEEEAYYAREAARGDLAGAPEQLGCYECGGFDGVTAPLRKVVARGPVSQPRFDPTRTYRLECGHLGGF